jgi:hypothetical protein
MVLEFVLSEIYGDFVMFVLKKNTLTDFLHQTQNYMYRL